MNLKGSINYRIEIRIISAENRSVDNCKVHPIELLSTVKVIDLLDVL
jgi:hypothetical protein